MTTAVQEKFALDIETDQLRQLLAAVKPAVASRVVTPALSGVKLAGTGRGLEVSATDTDVYVTAREGSFTVQGEVLVAFRTLEAVAAKLPAGKVTITEQDGSVKVQCGRSRYKLATFDLAGFPDFPEPKITQTITLDAELLAQSLGQVTVACAKSGTERPVLEGVRWDSAPGTLTLAATDSYLLVSKDIPTGNGDEIGVTLPSHALKMLAKLLDGVKGNVSVGLGEMQAKVTTDRFTLVTRLIEGAYPTWREYVDNLPTPGHSLTAGRDELIEAVEQAIAVRGERGILRIRGGEVVTLSVIGNDSSEIELECGWEGPEVEIGMNPEFLLTLLRTRVEDRLMLGFIGPAVSGIPRPVSISGEQTGHTTLFMPQVLPS